MALLLLIVLLLIVLLLIALLLRSLLATPVLALVCVCRQRLWLDVGESVCLCASDAGVLASSPPLLRALSVTIMSCAVFTSDLPHSVAQLLTHAINSTDAPAL